MKLPQLRDRKWNYLAISFTMPVTAILFLMIVVGATPFGGKSLLYSDCWHQYFPFFKAFRNALRSGESLLYSWNVGMGMDYLGLISYYLASPLNLLSVLLPESWVLPYFSLLMPIKLGLASLFFAIFLKKLFRKNDISIAVFGSFYALCAWALAYQWNIMWLDTFALLPLVALGTVCLLRDKKFILYTATLALSIFSNYYIGLFTCIFVLLLFICYQICCCKSIKRFFLDLCRIALFSILAIGMTAILELPALAALGNTYSSVNSFPEDFKLNIVDYKLYADARETWDAYKLAVENGEPAFKLFFSALGKSFGPVLSGMGQVAGNLVGGVTPSFKEGLPNIYTGISTLFLSFLFLMTRNVKLREKLCCIFLLLFFMASFLIRQLDYIWHGFHFTNMIPYRFSFLFSFVMLYMAYRAYLARHRFQVIHFVLAGLLTVEVFLLSQYAAKVPAALGEFGNIFSQGATALASLLSGNQDGFKSAMSALKAIYRAHGEVYVFLAYNVTFLALYLATSIYGRVQKALPKDATMEQRRDMVAVRRKHRSVSTVILVGVMVVELAVSVVNFGTKFSYTNLSDYPRGTDKTASMLRYMKEREDSLFYRTEMTHTQTLNDGALNDYYGISTFTSSANVKVTDFMCALGYGAQNNWNRYCFEEASPVANLFFNLKYMLERQGRVEENPYFDEVHHYDKVYLLENNAYLPLGFLAESSLGDVKLRSGSFHAFENQNALFSAATGIQTPVWNITPERWLTIKAEDVNITTQYNSGYCAYKVGDKKGTLTFRYAIEQEGFLCLDINMYARNDYYVYLNDEYLFSESITLPQTIAVSQVRPGDVVEIRVSCDAQENSNMSIRAALLDDAVFRSGYDILNASTMELTEFSTTKVAGTVDCNRDGILYTSIPDDGNWKATVDGREAEIVLVAGAMIGLNISEGNHEIVFTYENKAFEIGSIVTALCLLAFLILIYLQNRTWWNEKAKKLYSLIRRK